MNKLDNRTTGAGYRRNFHKVCRVTNNCRNTPHMWSSILLLTTSQTTTGKLNIRVSHNNPLHTATISVPVWQEHVWKWASDVTYRDVFWMWNVQKYIHVAALYSKIISRWAELMHLAIYTSNKNLRLWDWNISTHADPTSTRCTIS